MIKKLSNFKVSAGVLTDLEIATAFGCEVLSEAPFSEISEENHRKI